MAACNTTMEKFYSTKNTEPLARISIDENIEPKFIRNVGMQFVISIYFARYYCACGCRQNNNHRAHAILQRLFKAFG